MMFWQRRKTGNRGQVRRAIESLEQRHLLAGDALVAPPIEPTAPHIPTIAAIESNRPRLIVLTDIGGDDPDDEQSMVRLMAYANEFQIEGLIAGSHLSSDSGSSAFLIHSIVDRYEQVRENMLLHAEGFPSADELRSKIVRGQRRRSGFGANFDTPGSQLIIAAVDNPDPRPVNIAIWGGSTDLAQAFWRVREERSETEVAAFVSKLRIAWIEQDHSADWIKSSFPNLWIVSHLVLENPLDNAPFRGMYLGGDTSLTAKDWVVEKVKSHGPLGDAYPTVASGAAMKEGDTPTWFYFLPSDLSDPDHPEWGGWGGRFDAEGPLHSPARDTTRSGTLGRNTVNRWRLEFQNDFEARMDWTTESFAGANHNPIAQIDTDHRFAAVAGQTIEIDASGSWDPDSDSLSFEWFHYAEVGSYDGELVMERANDATLRFQAPRVSKTETAHIILKVHDDGGRDNRGPELFSYQRIIITLEPGFMSDINENGAVDFGDFLVLASNFGEQDANFRNGDLNGDQRVEFSDFLIFSSEITSLTLGPIAPTPFADFLVLSANFGDENATADQGDKNGDDEVNFADFLVLSGRF